MNTLTKNENNILEKVEKNKEKYKEKIYSLKDFNKHDVYLETIRNF